MAKKDAALPEPDTDRSDEMVVEVPATGGTIRIELDQDAKGKVTRHEFFQGGKKIAKRTAISKMKG